MTTTYQITRAVGRDGIRTRKNGEVAFATLEILDTDGHQLTLRIQTRADDPARPVFRTSYDDLIAENDAAVAFVQQQRIQADERKAAYLAKMSAADVEAEARYGAITIGTPKQIALAREVRARLVADDTPYLRGMDRLVRQSLESDDPAERDLAARAQAILPELYARAAFWLDVAHDGAPELSKWASATQPQRTRIGHVLEIH